MDLFEALLPNLAIAAKHSVAYRTIQDLTAASISALPSAPPSSPPPRAIAGDGATAQDAMGQEAARCNLNHEFRMPITLMLLPLERLIDLPELEPYRPRLLAMEVNARKLLRLVDGILDSPPARRDACASSSSGSTWH